MIVSGHSCPACRSGHALPGPPAAGQLRRCRNHVVPTTSLPQRRSCRRPASRPPGHPGGLGGGVRPAGRADVPVGMAARVGCRMTTWRGRREAPCRCSPIRRIRTPARGSRRRPRAGRPG